MPISSLGLAKLPILDPNVQAQQVTAGLDDALARLAMPPLQDPQMPDFQVDDPNQRVSFKDNPLGAIGLVLSNTAAGMRGQELPTDKLEQRQREDARLAKEQEMQEREMQSRSFTLGMQALETATEQMRHIPQEQLPAYIEMMQKNVFDRVGFDGKNLLDYISKGNAAEMSNKLAVLNQLGPQFAQFVGSDPEMLDKAVSGIIGATIQRKFNPPASARESFNNPVPVRGPDGKMHMVQFGSHGSQLDTGVAPIGSSFGVPDGVQQIDVRGIAKDEEAAAAAGSILSSLDVMDDIYSRYDGGLGAPVVGTVGRVALAIGAADADTKQAAEDYEQLNAQSKNIGISQLRAIGGNDTERELLTATQTAYDPADRTESNITKGKLIRAAAIATQMKPAEKNRWIVDNGSTMYPNAEGKTFQEHWLNKQAEIKTSLGLKPTGNLKAPKGKSATKPAGGKQKAGRFEVVK